MARSQGRIYDSNVVGERGGGVGRSTAIVVFTDLVGSTELRSRLGEEPAEELRRNHDRLIAGAVEANRGILVKNLGDGVMATFKGASDALGAAVAIQQALTRQNRSGSSDVPLEVRIGVSAGDVTFEEADCFGTPVIEAARLCAAADGGQILVTEVVRVLAGSAGGHQLASVGALDLKGLPAPVSACEVIWEPLAEPPLPMPPLLTRAGRIFVGRAEELERLLQLWKEAMAGERRVALLAGEPGIGKTRLATELAGAVREGGAVVLAGRCDEDLGVPYQPFVEALRHYVSATEERRLGRYAGELARLLPDLSELVSGLSEPLRSDPETERYRLFDALAAWLADVSADAPILLVLDDLHWAAKPTLQMLRHVLRSPEPLRLLVVVTYRDSDIGRGHPMSDLLAELRRDGGVERFALSGLDATGVAAFIEAAAGHSLEDDDAQELPRVVWRETEGNPFFVTEVMRHLSESRAIEQRDGRWTLNAAVDDLGIPEGVRDVVGRRLSRLAELTNRVLATAAVVGLEFEPAVVERAASVVEDELLAALEEATLARLLVEVSGARYRFSHALVRATLYDELTGARRVALHRRVAEAIESLHGRALDDHLPALAHHWARASAQSANTTRAVDYATRAGDRALAQLAHDEAVAYYRSAVELLDAAGEAPGSERAGLLISLGEAERRAGDASFRETLLTAADLAREAGDADRLARAALANHRGIWSSAGTVDDDRVRVLEAALAAHRDDPDSTVRARLLAQLALELTWAPESGRRQALCREALDIARRDGSPHTRGDVIVAAAEAIRNVDTIDERMALTAELLTVADVVSDPALSFWGNVLRGIAAGEVPDGAEMKRCVDAALRLADDLRQPIFGWMSRLQASILAATTGRLEDSERLALESFRLGQATGQVDAATFFGVTQFSVAFHRGRLGDVAAALSEALAAAPGVVTLQGYAAVACSETGRDNEARRLFESLMTRLPEFQKDLTWLRNVTQLASICAYLGDAGRASVLHELLVPYQGRAAHSGATWFGAVSHHLGLLATTLGRYQEAEQRFAAAERLHEDFGAIPWTARTRLLWAHMLLTRRQHGDTDRARELLGKALATARELGLAHVERRAVELLASD